MRYLFFIFILMSFGLNAQFGFDKIDHDFGDIYAGNDRTVDLKFRNTTGKDVYLLSIRHGREVRTLVSTKTVKPDSVMIIRVKYNPKETGKFKIEIPFYLSNSLEPFVFTIQGNVKEIDNSIGLDCPSFENKGPVSSPIFDFTATVLDAETGKPIKDAAITFVSNGIVAQIEKTNRVGMVETVSLIGLYYFVITADGYYGKEFQKYVNRNNDSILVYLNKPIIEEPIVIEEPLVIEEPIVIEKEEPVVVLEPKIDEPIIVNEEPILIEEPVVLEPIKDTTPRTHVPDIKEPKYKANNIVFLLDVSTSMNSDGKLDLLKASLIEMVKELRDEDRVTLISYSTFSKVIIEATSGSEKELLIKTIQGIKAQGMTAGGDGMKLAYRQALKHFIKGGNNQVIMATDGKFNQGNTNLDRLVEKNYVKGICLTVLGIKNKPEDAESMQQIAEVGGGNFLLIDSYEDSKQLLIEEIKRTSRINK